MTINVLYSGNKNLWSKYRDCLNSAFKNNKLKVVLNQEFDDPTTVDYIIYSPNGPFNDFSIFPNVKAVLSLWAGVETIVSNATLTQPLCRMVDEGLTNGMVEYIVGHTLRYHLGLDQQISQQDGIWRHDTMIPALANERNIGVIGLGSLGLACAHQLKQLNFNVSGWSRRKKKIKNKVFFPGYILIQMTESREARFLVENTNGVMSFVGPNNEPQALKDSEITRIMGEVEGREGREVVVAPYKIEDSVKVTDGPFADFTGLVTEVNDEKQKVKVSVSIFGRSTPIELDFLQVELEK